jgi:hypothetical protein
MMQLRRNRVKVTYQTTSIEIRRAVNGYVIRYKYYKLKGDDIQAHIEDTIIFADQDEMIDWLRKNS